MAATAISLPAPGLVDQVVRFVAKIYTKNNNKIK